ncbi:hypothetical protein B5F37_12845 [Drancourtella sp. An210]|nr:hypothetical protein B5F37_12845 [Drancourtella sp. An210]
MIKIVVIDDDECMRRIIHDKIAETAKIFGKTEIKIFSSAESFLEYAEQTEKGEEGDIFFVDIELAGMSGLELGKILRREFPGRALVFLTAYSEFALESYEIEADQYILKERMDERLPAVLEKLMCRMGAEKQQFRILGDGQEKKKVYCRDIICIHKKKTGKYAEYVTFQGEFRERISLEQLLKELGYTEFMLADRSNIVNLRNITRIKGNVLCMELGRELELNPTGIGSARPKEGLRNTGRNQDEMGYPYSNFDIAFHVRNVDVLAGFVLDSIGKAGSQKLAQGHDMGEYHRTWHFAGDQSEYDLFFA